MAARTRTLVTLNPKDTSPEQLYQKTLETPTEQIVVCFPLLTPIDFGALCYTRDYNTKRSSIKDVSDDDYRPERAEPLKNLLLAKSAKFQKNQRSRTFQGELTQLRHLIEWANNNGFLNVLSSAEDYKSVIQHYSLSVQPEIDNGRLNRKTGRTRQREFQKAGPLLFPGSDVNFETDIPVLWSEVKQEGTTYTPHEEEMGATIALCEAIFNQFSDFLINRRQFPFKVALPKCEGTLIAAEYVLVTPTLLQSNARKIAKSITWNFETCKIRHYDEIAKLCKRGTKYVSQILNKALKRSTQANQDMFHTTRRWILKQAHDAFLTLFIANSGINEQPARDLPWNSSYTIEDHESHGFAVIKYRANAKPIEVTIKKSFIGKFKKYLKLREFVDSHCDLPNLFFNVNGNNGKLTGSLSLTALSGFAVTVKTFIDPDYPCLSAMELRKYKSVQMLSQSLPLPVVAAVLQNSEATARKHYSDPNERVSIDEVSSMLSLLMENLDAKPSDERATPSGACGTEDKALPLSTIPDGYEPNCKNFAGCIFCKYFGLRADENGVRKILSMRYFVKEQIYLCDSQEHFDRIHGAVIDRLDLFIKSLIQERPEMEAVVVKVDDEISRQFKLTEYWNRQLYRIQKFRGEI